VLIAGLTGGMACGKTFVAQILHSLGCYIIEADAIGHEVMQPGGEAYGAVVEAFGGGILNAEGVIERSRLAALVFTDPAELTRLNAIVHPAVRAHSGRQFDEIRERDPHAIVIYVAAILIETGGYSQFEKIIVVTCTREQQIERAMERPHAKMSDVLARLDRQMPLKKKLEFADYIVDASGAKEETWRQTKMVYDDLRRLAS
jgi:dephospho-CoA kinase